MKNFLNVFSQPKKENSRTRFEQALETQFEKQYNKISHTEPDRHGDVHVPFQRSPRIEEEDQPVVKMLNPLKGDAA